MAMNLSDRIKMINLRNGCPTEQCDECKEAQAEERLVADVEKVWEEEKERLAESAERELTDTVPASNEILAELHAMRVALEEQGAMLAKINKHINATQKMLKKEKK